MVDLLSTVEEPEKTTFKKLGLHENTLKTLENIGYHTPSPIQAGFIPVAVTGRDCTGQARTGTGKTAAFVIPILEQLDPEQSSVQALVLCPTRELTEQVASEATRLAQKHDTQPVLLVGGRPLRARAARGRAARRWLASITADAVQQPAEQSDCE